MEMSHLVCGGCGTLLMYTRGATSVRCSCCQTINHARAGTFLWTFCKLSDIILCICFQWFHLSVSSYRCIFVMLFIFLQVAVLCEALFGKKLKKKLLPGKTTSCIQEMNYCGDEMVLRLQIFFCQSLNKCWKDLSFCQTEPNVCSVINLFFSFSPFPLEFFFYGKCLEISGCTWTCLDF